MLFKVIAEENRTFKTGLKRGGSMQYLTAEQVGDWARHQPDDGFYCEHCLTRLVQTDEGLYYCPNEMCLYDEQGKIDPEDEGD